MRLIFLLSSIHAFLTRVVSFVALSACVAVSTAGCGHARETAVIESGETILLHLDGTWALASAIGADNEFYDNLHSHTSYSDGDSTPDVAYAYARYAADLNILAITEHNHRWAPIRIETNEDLYSGNYPMSLSFSILSRSPFGTSDVLILNVGLHVAPTADQGSHLENWGAAAVTRTGVIAPVLTKSAIFAGLRNRHVYASDDRNLRIISTVKDQLNSFHAGLSANEMLIEPAFMPG